MKDFIKKHKIEVISASIFVILMLFACIHNFGMKGDEVEKEESKEIQTEVIEEDKELSTEEKELDEEAVAETEALKEDEVEAVAEVDVANCCSISVSCSTILSNLDDLKSGKEDLLPKDGIFLSIDDAEFEDGETAFDLLRRELDKKGISLNYKETQFSAGCYIESIGGIGELDCGQTSGWLYKVNGKMPNVASSNYILKKSDKIEFVYSCKMGDI